MIDYKLIKSDDINADMKNLYDIVTFLRDPKDGCPWDREQMPKDIIRSMQGEIYEYIDALNDNDKPHQSEELGDVFLNLFLLAKIHEQNGDFKLSDCLNDACEKYIRRHPHVFSDVKITDTSDVLDNWNKIKREQEGRIKSEEDFFDGLTDSAPELEKCYSLSKKAAKIGFDWHNFDGVLNKVNEELSEVVKAETEDEILEELGDLLFSVVQLCRKKHVKPQDALSHANRKFIKRFNLLWALAKEEGLELEKLSDDEWNNLWNKVKVKIH
ncbi:MAG: nucleoside triphosphate pyrophosphohydrolase [Sphaerochaeta sp.]